MQKKLIALAIAGLSGAAFAQSNVTVYGQVNMSYESLSGTKQNAAAAYTVGSATAKNINALKNMDSRIGFKGEEALGGGLKAVFTLEFGVNPDQAAANTNSAAAGGTTGLETNARQTFAGLSGGFGTVTWGRQYTPFFEAAAAIDPFGASTTNVASAANIHPVTAVARANNSVKYVGAFDAAGGKLILAGLYGLSERPTTAATDTGKVWNWKIAYAAGPLLVGLTQIKLTDSTAGVAATAGENTKATAFGGTYDFKVAKLHALWDKVKVDGLAAGTTADRSDYMFGVSVPMGAHTLKGEYNSVNDKLAANNDATHIGLGYSYAMSKRTSLFANYGKVSNKNGAAFSIGAGANSGGTLGVSNTVAANAGGRTTGYQIGMAHSF